MGKKHDFHRDPREYMYDVGLQDCNLQGFQEELEEYGRHSLSFHALEFSKSIIPCEVCAYNQSILILLLLFFFF